MLNKFLCWMWGHQYKKWLRYEWSVLGTGNKYGYKCKHCGVRK